MSLDLSQTATDLLGELGSKTYVKLVSETASTSDPVTGIDTTGTITTTDLTGVVLRIPQKMIDGERILATDKMIMIDNSVTPTSKDKVQIDLINYRIVEIDGFNHAGTQQFWKLIIRG